MSLGQQQQAGIHSLIVNGLSSAASSAGGGSVASTLVTGLLDLLWPPSQEDVWDSIKDDVQNLINQSISDEVYKSVSDKLSDLETNIGFYRDAVRDKQDINGTYLATRGIFGRLAEFRQEGHEILLLPLYAQAVNLLLSLLRDGVLYGAKWNIPIDTDEAQRNINQLLYTHDGGPLGAIDYVEHWFSQGIPGPVADSSVNMKPFMSYANQSNYITQMMITVMDHRAMWRYFDPSQYPPGRAIPRYTREIFSASFQKLVPNAPGYGNNDASLPNWGEGPNALMSVTGWGDTRPTGVQCVNGDGQKPMEGGTNGTDPTTDIENLTTDPIVSATFSTVTLVSDNNLVPTFDKQVRLYTRGGRQAWLGPSNAPVHVNDMNWDLPINSTNVHTSAFDDHVVSSIHVNYWAGVPLEYHAYNDPIAVCNIAVGFRRWDSYADRQAGWQRCGKCQSLFLEGVDSANRCRDNGQHEAIEDNNFTLFHSGHPPETDAGWSWCNRCGGMYLRQLNNNGLHDNNGSAEYVMLKHVAELSGGPLSRTGYLDGGWKACSKCALLFRSQDVGSSWCPADGGNHSSYGDHDYVIKHIHPIGRS